VVVALSGGVDSSLLAYLANEELGDGALAVTVVSESLSSSEYQDAHMMADTIGIRHRVVELSDLDDPEYASNPPNRCALCRVHSARALWKVAKDEGIKTVIDGNNASDLGDYRPGIEASSREGIHHPFIENGVTKEMIRKEAKAADLPIHDKPASACLASRLPYGEEITKERLDRIDSAEEFLRSLGFQVVRVRDHGSLARIEVESDRVKDLLGDPMRDEVTRALLDLGYTYITVDISGYRTGSLNDELEDEDQ